MKSMLSYCYNQPREKIYLYHNGRSYNYGWLQDTLQKLNGLLSNLGLAKGDRLILASTDKVELSCIFLAAVSNGIGVIVIDADTKEPRVKAIIDKVAPAVIIADSELAESWQLKTVGKIVTISKSPKAGSLDYVELFEKATPVDAFASAAPDSLAYIMFTSGTTSEPKGVAISYNNLITHLQTLQKAYSLNENSQILNQLILSHADGLIQGPVLAAFTGCTWHCPFDFSINKIPELLQYVYSSGVTHFFAVPTMLHFIEQNGEGHENGFCNPAFKLVISVSANVPHSLWQSFEDRFKVKLSNVYGLTETVAGSVFCIANTDSYKRFSIGKPIDCQVKIVDDNNEVLSQGQKGELCLQGQHIMKGYWHNQERTDEVIKDGWLHTGDIAEVDADGYIKITGRKKNTIISGGLNIQPEEITECLLFHPSISEAVAFAMSDEILGEKLAVAIVPASGANLTEDEVIEFCSHRLEKKMLPQKVIITDSLPKGISGKVQLEKVRQIAENSQVKTTNDSDVSNKLVSIIADVFHRPKQESDLKLDFFELGGDSLLAALFISKIEDAFDIKLPFREIFRNSKLADLADHISQLKQKQSERKNDSVKIEVSRLTASDKDCKVVILANHYYEVNLLCDELKDKFEVYFVQYRLADVYRDSTRTADHRLPSIEKIADEINDQLRQAGIIDEKIVLVGFSFGGLIAYEMSKSLINSSEIKHHKLVMLDAVVSDLRYSFLTRYRVKFRRKLDTIQLNIKNGVENFNRKYLTSGDLKERVYRQNRQFVDDYRSYHTTYFDLAKKVINDYVPKTLERGDVVLITSNRNEARNENNLYWKQTIKEGLSIINVPGNHMTFLKEPNLSKWLPKLKQILEEKCGKSLMLYLLLQCLI